MVLNMIFRAIPIYVHSAIEVLAAPVLMAAPFFLGFSPAAGAFSFIIGAILLGLGIAGAGEGPRGTIPLSAHAGFDVAVASATVVLGLIIGLATSSPVAAIFLAGFGTAHLALTASTRFSRPLGA